MKFTVTVDLVIDADSKEDAEEKAFSFLQFANDTPYDDSDGEGFSIVEKVNQ